MQARRPRQHQQVARSPVQSTATGTIQTKEHGQLRGAKPNPGSGCGFIDLGIRQYVSVSDAGPFARHLQCLSTRIGIRAVTSCQKDVHRQFGLGHGHCDGWQRDAHAAVPEGRASAFSRPTGMLGSGRRVVPPTIRSGLGRENRPRERRRASIEQPPGWRWKVLALAPYRGTRQAERGRSGQQVDAGL